ncbi:hypothetical protein H8E88_36025 [candidate division KSB1 bacterium]|nr:hypothetical protein [candidate division KSB1 bacterium]
MKKSLTLAFVLLIFNSLLYAQKYVTVGAGVSGAFYNSKGLKEFKETYNLMNQNYLKQLMKGLSQPLGLRGEIAFRYFSDRFNFAGLAGLQHYTIKDVAEYHNTESRYFELKATGLYLEGEFGLNFDGFFVNGVVTLFHNNGVTLKSEYSFPPTTEETIKALDGNFKGESYYSTDLGMAFGIVKEPIVISLKVTYPVYAVGGSAVLRDKNSTKVTMGTDIFPDDYGAYLFSEPYDGIKSNIDGLKILLTVAFVIPLGD